MKIAFLAPHIFMHKDIIDRVIFSPGRLAIDLVEHYMRKGHEVTFFSPGYDIDGAENIHPDMAFFEEELRLRGYGFIELLKKHPLTFISLARQVQAELISKAYEMGNAGKFDIIHSYMNEEETALAFANHSKSPVVFTHHEPYNFLPKYRSSFPKYKDLNWISMSYAQRKTMPDGTNWVGNVYHGLASVNSNQLPVNRDLKKKVTARYEAPLRNASIPRSSASSQEDEYFAYFGRIIEPKGVHLAIAAARKAGVNLKIAGKHYSGSGKDSYWESRIVPELDSNIENRIQDTRNKKDTNNKLQRDDNIQTVSKIQNLKSKISYVGFINKKEEKRNFLQNASALLVPSTWDEPFGMVMIEALACGTPVIGLDSGAIPEVVVDGKTGYLVGKRYKKQDARNKKDTNNKKQSGGINQQSAIINHQLASKIQNPKSIIELDEEYVTDQLAEKINQIDQIDRKSCLEDFKKRFTLERMGDEYLEIYQKVIDTKSGS